MSSIPKPTPTSSIHNSNVMFTMHDLWSQKCQRLGIFKWPFKTKTLGPKSIKTSNTIELKMTLGKSLYLNAHVPFSNTEYLDILAHLD